MNDFAHIVGRIQNMLNYVSLEEVAWKLHEEGMDSGEIVLMVKAAIVLQELCQKDQICK